MAEVEKKVEEQEIEDEKKVGEPRIYPQIIATVIANLTLVSAGLCYAWTSIALLEFESPRSRLEVTKDQASWIATGLPIGCVIGPVTTALLVDRIGRKWFIYGTSVPYAVSWFLIYFAQDWVMLLVARIICGISVGAALSIVPAYVSEIVDVKIRGAANTIMTVLLNLGYVIVYGIGPQVGSKMLALVGLVPIALLILLWLWLPESPYYFLKKKRDTSADLSLVWLRRSKNNDTLIAEMKEYIEIERTGGLKELFSNSINRKALWLVLFVYAGQMLSGMMAVQEYVGIIIRDMNLSLSTHMVLLILGAVSLVSGAISALLIDRIGRKPVFLISTYISALCLLVIGVYFFLSQRGTDVRPYALAPLVAVIVYFVIFYFGLGSVPAIISSELFTIGVKMWGLTIANTFGGLLAIIVSKAYEPLRQAVGVYLVFFIFAGIELLIASVAIFILPETKCKSFAEIQEMLRGKKPKQEKTENLNE